MLETFLIAGLLIAVFVAFKNLSRLEHRLQDLEARLAELPQAIVTAAHATSADTAQPPPGREAGSDQPEPDAAPESDEPEAAPPDEKPAIAAAAASAAARTATFEEAVGTKWTVWLGGLALALGAVFLVRFTIESGLLGPGVRVLLGALLALVLLGGGEFARRRELTSPVPGLPAAHIPAVLTAVGSLAGFATIYAAYALYGFLDPLAAFMLLAIVSLLSLGGALLHGPALAALGLVGSYATPLLVAADSPSAWTLFLYLMFVTGSAYALADARRWLWVAISAGASAVLWALFWLAGPWVPDDNPPLAVFMAVLFVLTLFFLRDEIDATQPDAEQQAGPDLVAGGILAAIGFLALPLLRLNEYDSFSLGLLAATMAALIGSAWRWPRLSLLTWWAAGLFTFGYVSWHIPALMDPDALDRFTDFARTGPAELRSFLITGAGFAGAVMACGVAASLVGKRHPAWAGTAVAAPLVTFIYAYFRAVRFEQSPPFAFAALVLAAGLAIITEIIQSRTRPDDDTGTADPVAIYAAGAIGWLALALTIELEKGWLTIALALLTAGLGWLSLKRPYWVFRPLALGFAGIVTVRLILDPFFAGQDLGTTPIFNWLLYGYGVPAVAFAAAAWTFRQRHDDITVRVLEGAAIAYAVVLASLEIRHLMNGGDVGSQTFDLAEMSVHTLTWLGLSAGLNRRYRRSGRKVTGYASTVLGVTGLAAVAFGHLVVLNPAFTGASIGTGVIFNDLQLGYAVPAIMCLLLAYMLGETPYQARPPLFDLVARTLALILAFAYLSLEVMALYQGPWLSPSATSDAELYTYSAVWLVYGIALLAGGVWFASAALRYASFAVVMLTVAKVFLIDMSALTGVLRALSFLALGLVLIGIGTVYQKLVFPRRNTAGVPDAPADEDSAGSADTTP